MKFIPTLVMLVVGVAAVAAAAPALMRVTDALIPLILVAGIVTAVLRLVWFYTQR
jgi:hypothetical protein